MNLLLDTNTLSYALRGQSTVLERMEQAGRRGAVFLLTPVVHYELFRYLELKGSHRLLRLYRHLTSSWHRCEMAFEDWTDAALLWAERHRHGRPISDLDLFLAVLARRHDAVLVTSNTRHFEGLGLELEDWASG